MDNDMTKNMDSRKFLLIERIIGINNEEELSRLESQLQTGGQYDLAVKPLRASVSLADLVEEQHYQPINKEEFFQMTENLEWDESIDELLEMLTP
jgi:hypothetical protein